MFVSYQATTVSEAFYKLVSQLNILLWSMHAKTMARATVDHKLPRCLLGGVQKSPYILYDMPLLNFHPTLIRDVIMRVGHCRSRNLINMKYFLTNI